MTYLEVRPIPELADHIQLVWAMESGTEDDVFPREQIMPDGIVEIVFHWGDPWHTFEDNRRFLQPQSFAISMMRKLVEIESAGRTGFISVRFYPWGAYHFFAEPIRNFLDQTIPCERLWPELVDGLMKDLSADGPIEGRIDIVQSFLLDRLRENRRDQPEIDDAIRLIRDSQGRLSIAEICERTSLSKKQLERRFLASIGTTPKIFSRISRFLAICHHLKEHSDRSLTGIAYECGFYDQAHFIKEFKEFSGLTPKEFFRRSNVVFSEL
ncbi:MAG: helix-turn-helix domain-containing protein [Gemmatimonadota bacterium]|nr:helix-turn-helix domain-containing protein [Gemmatimonadota bacterium]